MQASLFAPPSRRKRPAAWLACAAQVGRWAESDLTPTGQGSGGGGGRRIARGCLRPGRSGRSHPGVSRCPLLRKTPPKISRRSRRDRPELRLGPLALSISDHLAVIVLSVSGNGSRSDRAARDNKARSRDREACPVESPGATGEIEARGGSVCGVGARAATGVGDSLPFRSEAGARRRRQTGGAPGQT